MNPFRNFLLMLVMVLFLAAELQAQAEESAVAEAPAAEQPGTSDAQPNIYPWLAARLVARGVPVIDVRSAEEVAATGTLADAVNIVHTDTAALIDFIGEDRDRTVVLYCGSGRRAARVIEALREQGYHNLVNAGGYEDLAEALNQP